MFSYKLYNSGARGQVRADLYKNDKFFMLGTSLPSEEAAKNWGEQKLKELNGVSS